MEENKESIFYYTSSEKTPSGIATLANENALKDLELLLVSLQLWNKELPILYIACTKGVSDVFDEILKKTNYKGEYRLNFLLEPYVQYNRSQMEKMPSMKGYPNLWFDFMLEKTHLIDWVLEEHEKKEKKEKDKKDGGVLFCDADICWLGPLPKIPANKTVGVSPHGIRAYDEAKFGIYNGGFLWTNSKPPIETWREATKTSTFFEQMSIQDIVYSLKPEEVYIFKEQFNYGWWRMFQSASSIETKKKEWSVFRSSTEDTNSGIRVQTEPLSCIHTHFTEKKDVITVLFNRFVIEKLELLAKQKNHLVNKKIQVLLDFIKAM